jgi:hypothetical protein
VRAAALVFTAFWLIATSSKNEPPRECYTGIGDTALLRVVVGPSQASTAPSCGGADGLVSGATPVFHLVKSKPSDGCIGWETRAVDGVVGVTVPSDFHSGATFFTLVFGRFTAPQDSACTGEWQIYLQPQTLPPVGQTISPLDAGTAQSWIVHRSIAFESAACQRLFTGDYCQDTFAVDAITAP